MITRAQVSLRVKFCVKPSLCGPAKVEKGRNVNMYDLLIKMQKLSMGVAAMV